MTFSEKFKAARMQAGISQEKLSAELGISKRTIINYENGQTFPSSDKLPLIAKYFGIRIENLISDDEEFVASAYEQGGSKSAREAKTLVNEVSGLFAGGMLSEDDMDAAMKAIQNAYWIAKEESRRKYTPKKYRNTVDNE
ncbi:MAG: helix-turn-helix domain-containing protein [Clostridiales bacterium]|jgi:transcriptional regulator with XRE-family HTH domain|nr:helix-turn-helix domain-containing protein [Clostridiales bacterium]